MKPWVERLVPLNAELLEAHGPISPEEVDGSYLSWLRFYHFRYKSPGMKEAMVLATNAVLTNKPLPVGEEKPMDMSRVIE